MSSSFCFLGGFMIYYILGYIVGKYHPFSTLLNKITLSFKKKEVDKNV